MDGLGRALSHALLPICVLGLGCERNVSIGRWLDAAIPADGNTPIDTTFSCGQRGPLFDLGDGLAGACGASSRGFHYALCSCSDIVSNALISTDGFDSQEAAYLPGEASGALASVGAFYPHAARIGGSLIVAGGDGIPLNDDLSVGGNLFDLGQLQGQYSVRVAGRARLAGDVRVSQLTVADSCSLAPQAALEVAAGAPAITREAISLAAPCRCDAALDIASLIDAASRDNDNAVLLLDAESWLKVLDAPRELSLPCGRYYSSNLNGARPITLHIQGRVALYVQNAIVIEDTGGLTIDLASGAELDLFVQNGISAGGPVQIGDPSSTTRVRLHAGGPDTVFFGDRTTIAGSLYAPRSELVSSGAFELYGAALVRRISADQTLTLHYDRALARDDCNASHCTSTADCPDSLRCDRTRCLP